MTLDLESDENWTILKISGMSEMELLTFFKRESAADPFSEESSEYYHPLFLI
jgi:hypothetical protein